MGKKCTHRYKGIYGKYVPRFKQRKIDGEWYFCTDYQCQIKGCSHWKLNNFKHKLKRRLHNRKSSKS